jgi:hypothetical protein
VLLPSLPAAVLTATSAAPSPEEVPFPLQQDALPVLLRRGGGWKPSVFQVQLAEGHDAVVKHYRVSTPFTQEQKVLLLCAAAGVPAPRLLRVFDDGDSRCLLLRPLAQHSLMDAPFSLELFANVVAATREVLASLHRRQLVHGDVTPSNCLVMRASAATAAGASPIAAVAVHGLGSGAAAASAASASASASSSPSLPDDPWVCLLNDFGSSGPANQEYEDFCGTADFAAPAWAAMFVPLELDEEEATSSSSAVATPAGASLITAVCRTPLLDWCGLFFTLLFFANPDHSPGHRRLPWTRTPDDTRMWLQKVLLTQPANQARLLRGVHRRLLPFMQDLATCIFSADACEEVVLKLLRQPVVAASLSLIAEE